MSRLGMFACLLMLVAVAVCLDMPAHMKPPELPKEAQGHQLPGRPDAPRFDEQRPNIPPPEGQPPKESKPDAKPPQEAKS